MDPPQGVPPQETEAELERFRKQWQEEVQKKTRSTSGLTSTTANAAKLDRRREPAAPSASSSSSSPSSSSALAAPKSQSTRLDAHDGRDEHEPHTYHDLPDREAELRLDAADHGYVRGSSARAEPTSALEHYERAVEKETQGSLGDSLKHYRKAFKVGIIMPVSVHHMLSMSFPRSLMTACTNNIKTSIFLLRPFPPSGLRHRQRSRSPLIRPHQMRL